MNKRWYPIITAVVVLAIMSLSPAAAEAQRGGGGDQQPAGPTPTMSNGKPDLSGHWANPYTPNMAGRGGASVYDPETRQPLDWPRKGEPLPDAAVEGRTFDLPYTELGLRRWKEYDAAANGDYAGSCMPFGWSRSINSPHGVQIIHNEDAIAFLWEQNTWFHWVPTTEGFEWPEDLPPAWNGYSTGRWDGDTLVIETTKFNGYTKLDTQGHPHSTSVKFINTFTRVDENTIEHTVTVDDPVHYTQPWMNIRTWTLRDYPDVIMEYSCEENNLGLFDGGITPWRIPDEVD